MNNEKLEHNRLTERTVYSYLWFTSGKSLALLLGHAKETIAIYDVLHKTRVPKSSKKHLLGWALITINVFRV